MNPRACSQAWPEPVWNGDIDINAGARVLRVLAARTGTPYEHVRAMTLSAYAHHLTAPVPSLFDEAAAGKKLRFCGTCLQEDAIPYYRREWRLSFITACVPHQAPLRRNCAECGRAVDLQQVPLEADGRHSGFGPRWSDHRDAVPPLPLAHLRSSLFARRSVCVL
jgi:TniQ